MAIVKMKKLALCALKKDRKNILESLQRAGVVQVEDGEMQDELFEKIDTKQSMEVFRSNAKVASDALEILDHFTVSKGKKVSSLVGRDSISKEDYYEFVDNAQEIMRIAYTICDAQNTISEKKTEIVRLTLKKDSLKPWMNLDVNMNFKGTKFTKAFIGTVPGEQDEESLLAAFKRIAPDIENIEFEIVSKSIDATYVFVVCKKENSIDVEEALKNMGFSPPVSITKHTPEYKIEKISEKIKALEEDVNDVGKLIASYEGARNAMRFIIDYYSIRSEKYEVISKLQYTKHTFMLFGFVPEKEQKKLEKVLSNNFTVAFEFSSVEDGEFPILLKNSALASPVEPVLESYSLPGKGEVDPTSTMAFFYYILFGLMLSDAAYGILITIGCLFALIKFKNMEPGLKKSLNMFLYCGISTTFWGIMFGSYFGDAIEVISETFFHHKITIPALWFVPLNEPMRMLAYSFGFGILHLFAGLFLKICQLFKAKKYKDIFYDVISWYLLVGGSVVYLLSIPMMTKLLTLSFVLSRTVANASLICIAVGALTIVLTSGRESKNPFKRLLKGLYSLYGVTSYVSDIFSYSRLLALGLATGVIAQVFNKMGVVAGSSVLGAIVFTTIFLIGHTMNIGINLLGAYVHTNRLQFVEFFSKFYEGGGKKFSPFSINTKYYKIKEDI